MRGPLSFVTKSRYARKARAIAGAWFFRPERARAWNNIVRQPLIGPALLVRGKGDEKIWEMFE